MLDADNLRKLTSLAKEDRPFKDPIKLVRIYDKANGFKGCVLVDGFHRVEAMTRAGKKTIPAIIKEGTKLDAVLEAAKANQQHGLPTSTKAYRDALSKVVRAGGYKNKHGIKPIKTLVVELGIPCNERTARRWMQQDTPAIYRQHYAQKADNETTATSPKPRSPDFTLEVDGIKAQLTNLIEKLRHHRNRPEAQNAAFELEQALAAAVKDMQPIWNEFAEEETDAEEGIENPF